MKFPSSLHHKIKKYYFYHVSDENSMLINIPSKINLPLSWIKIFNYEFLEPSLYFSQVMSQTRNKKFIMNSNVSLINCVRYTRVHYFRLLHGILSNKQSNNHVLKYIPDS